MDLQGVPNFCAHEHWGSIDSIGMASEGFRADAERGATPGRRTGVFDILLDPYFDGWLRASGVDVDGIARQAGAGCFSQLADDSVHQAMQALSPVLDAHRLTGAYQCVRRGILALYGTDIESGDLQALDGEIASRYAVLFDWYRAAMKKAHFRTLVRPVHPEYFVRSQTTRTARQEVGFTHTVMRIDGLLDLWMPDHPRRLGLAGITGIEPLNAESWREFLGRLFDLASAKHCLGIKQLQAYSRSLAFTPRSDAEVVWWGGLSPQEVRTFQDWVVHECCKQAHDRGWVHQIHVGTHNLAQSSPLPLADLAGAYPRMKIVQLHCWPFHREAGFLAKQYPNVYIDACWQAILNPSFLRESLATWLGYVPTSKIMCSHDATSIEMAAGSSIFTREILAESLTDASRHAGLTKPDLRRIATDILNNNAVGLYGVGAKV